MPPSTLPGSREQLLARALTKQWQALKRRGIRGYRLDPTTCEDAIMCAALTTLEALTRHNDYGCVSGLPSENRIVGLLWIKFHAACIDILRELRRRQEDPLEEGLAWLAPSGVDLVDIIVARDMLKRCRIVLDGMSHTHGDVVRLTAIGYEQGDIEATTGLSRSNIRQIRRRFRLEVDQIAA